MFFLVYLWLFQVETKGRSYGELDELFAKRISVKEFSTYETEFQKQGIMSNR
jgi:MFS transporter, SP family, general alpha glucoside:H+ symporter